MSAGVNTLPGAAVSFEDLQRIMNNAVAGNLGFAPIVKSFDGRSESTDPVDFLDNFIEMANFRGWDDQCKFKNFSSFLEGTAKNWHKLKVRNSDRSQTVGRS